jgi:hypothetical protein
MTGRFAKNMDKNPRLGGIIIKGGASDCANKNSVPRSRGSEFLNAKGGGLGRRLQDVGLRGFWAWE